MTVEEGADASLRILEQAWRRTAGWYTQRAVAVEGEQLDALIEELQRARGRADRRRADGPGSRRGPDGARGVPAGRGRVLPFRARRPAPQRSAGGAGGPAPEATRAAGGRALPGGGRGRQAPQAHRRRTGGEDALQLLDVGRLLQHLVLQQHPQGYPANSSRAA